MRAWERVQGWFGLVANVAILVGIVLVVLELRQNTDHLRLTLLDQINSRLYENNRAVMGDDPLPAIEKSLVEPGALTYSEFRIVDAYLINAVNEWEDRYFLYRAGLADASEWRRRVDEDVAWYFGNRFAKSWWRTNGTVVLDAEVVAYVSIAVEAVPEDATLDFFYAALRDRP